MSRLVLGSTAGLHHWRLLSQKLFRNDAVSYKSKQLLEATGLEPAGSPADTRDGALAARPLPPCELPSKADHPAGPKPPQPAGVLDDC